MYGFPSTLIKAPRRFSNKLRNILKVLRKVQDGRKVTQPVLKYLLMVAVQHNSTGLINTQYRSDYARSHAGHVVL
jgi:hypothetical protein